jgi:hypothetical protein
MNMMLGLLEPHQPFGSWHPQSQVSIHWKGNTRSAELILCQAEAAEIEHPFLIGALCKIIQIVSVISSSGQKLKVIHEEDRAHWQPDSGRAVLKIFIFFEHLMPDRDSQPTLAEHKKS